MVARLQRMVHSYFNLPDTTGGTAAPLKTIDYCLDHDAAGDEQDSSKLVFNIKVVAIHMLVAVATGVVGSTLWMNFKDRYVDLCIRD